MTQVDIACTDLDTAIAFYADLGFRHDMIMPADAPRLAQLSGHGLTLRLTLSNAPHQTNDVPTGLIITRAGDAWGYGRAGMQYRDLIPGRMGGRFIASHISIPEGGPVADYVHHHDIRFQMIYCRKGWVRVVYEDQGPPFVMHEGDCVLQPPHIRHRVLEASPGLEVIEIASPADHETWRDHDLELPTQSPNPQRDFNGQRFVHHMGVTTVTAARIYAGQRFVRHIAAAAPRSAIRDTGIAAGTNRLAGARVITLARDADYERRHDGEFLFFAVLKGGLSLTAGTHGTHILETGDICALPTDAAFAMQAMNEAELLEVTLPAHDGFSSISATASRS